MMAATAALQNLQTHERNQSKGTNEVSREEIKTASEKAVELRALHAALMQVNRPSNFRFSSASLAPPHLSAHDYPVFTPSYDDEPLPGCRQIQFDSPAIPECWDDEYGDETMLSDYKKANASSRKKGLASELFKLEPPHVCPAEDQKSISGSSANNISVARTSPRTEFHKSRRRNSLGDLKSVSSCNRCRPAIIETDNATKSSKNSNTVVPLTDSHASVQSQPKSRGLNLSWLFPRIKKKNKNGSSPNRAESEEVSQVYKDLGIISIETLKNELVEANARRDAAITEVAEMRSSLGDLKEKLENLENYCEELRKALRQAVQSKDSQVLEKLGNLPKGGKLNDGKGRVSDEAMVEGFLQIVSEARLSVKQFCKTLIRQIEETDNALKENLNLLLQPYKLSLNYSKYSKAVIYHLEGIINRSLYQDFENPVFQKNGSPKLLDPHQDRQAQFSSFVSLRDLSWNEVLRKGTKYYSEEFSKFCDEKMSCIITSLNWTRPWPEQLLQSFFVAAKCIWLLHLLAFSFDPPLGILRVEENRSFDPHYMEDVFADRKRSVGPSRVKIMVMPGFYVQERVLRCKVLCRYKSPAA